MIGFQLNACDKFPPPPPPHLKLWISSAIDNFSWVKIVIRQFSIENTRINAVLMLGQRRSQWTRF